MSHNPIRLQVLFNRYVQGQLTAQELEEFWQLLAELDEKDLLEEDLKALWEKQRIGIRPSDGVNWSRVEDKLNQRMTESETNFDRFKVKRMQWWKYAAAAVVIAVIVFAGKQFLDKKETAVTAKADIAAPDKSRAMITLADGKTTVYVDQIKNGEQLVAQNGLTVSKGTDGVVRYTVSGQLDEKNTAIGYHTFSNPRGSKAQAFGLDDGTVIWLNAGSSVKYPMAFVAGKKREVELIEGEAFFEVKHDAKRPFVLKAGNELIEDLGTSFNVNRYAGERVQTTLIDGALKVNRQEIHPGEQYVNGQISKPELEQVIAWKNGQFSFNELSVEDILKQAAVWYDVEVVFEGTVSEKFSFSVDRSKPISALLHAMELSGGVHFEVDGRTVRVRP